MIGEKEIAKATGCSIKQGRPSGRRAQVTGEISSMVDILFSVYHYKTGDIQLLKHSKYIEIKRNLLPLSVC